MYTFYNIEVKNGIFTATVVNDCTGAQELVEAKVDGSYHSSKYSDVIKATWNVVVSAEKTGKYPKQTSVAWG